MRCRSSRQRVHFFHQPTDAATTGRLFARGQLDGDASCTITSAVFSENAWDERFQLTVLLLAQAELVFTPVVVRRATHAERLTPNVSHKHDTA